MSDINAKKPFVMAFSWTTGGGHLLVGYGYGDNGNYVDYMDPWPNHGYTRSLYDWVVSASDHNWVAALEIDIPMPTISNVTSGSTTATTSSVSGTVNPNGASTNAYVVYRKSEENTVLSSSAHTLTGTSGQNVSFNLASLSPNTTYNYRLVADNSGGQALSDRYAFTTASQIATISNVTSGSTTDTASSVSGTVNPHGGSTNVYVVYRKSQENAVLFSSAQTLAGTSGQNLSFSLSSLSPNTTYYCRLFADNSGGQAMSDRYAFTTTSQIATISNVTSGSSTATTSSVSGTVNPNGGSTKVYVVYRKSEENTVLSSSAQTLTGTSGQNVSFNLASLSPNTTYYCRLFADNSGGQAMSDRYSFTTTIQSPTISKVTSGNTTSTSSSVSGTVNPNGGSTNVYVNYRRSQDTSATASSTETISGTSGQTVSFSLSSLSPNTTYFYRVMAENSGGQSVSDRYSFTTSATKHPITGVEETP